MKNLFILLFLFSNSLFSQVSSAPAASASTSFCPIVKLYTQTVSYGGDGLWHEYIGEEPSDGYWINYGDRYKIELYVAPNNLHSLVCCDCEFHVVVRNTEPSIIYDHWINLEPGTPTVIFQDNFIAEAGDTGREKISISISSVTKEKRLISYTYRLWPGPGGE